MSEDRFMRLVVFFDLPVTTKEKRRAANSFRRFLLKDGFIMVQLSVYSRIVKSKDYSDKHLARLAYNIPSEGYIRCLEVTEKQYANMKILLGPIKKQEEKISAQQLLLF